tara:strand:- start:301 stop:612 length:312 start_codon:yes stop_codon:yes gene_type:complete
MGSLYVVSGKSFYRAFTISSNEDSSVTSIHHEINNAREYLDKAWPFAKPTESDTQGVRTDSDGAIGDIASIIVTYSDATYKKKTYKRNFGVTSDYVWTEETGV